MNKIVTAGLATAVLATATVLISTHQQQVQHCTIALPDRSAGPAFLPTGPGTLDVLVPDGVPLPSSAVIVQCRPRGPCVDNCASLRWWDDPATGPWR